MKRFLSILFLFFAVAAMAQPAPRGGGSEGVRSSFHEFQTKQIEEALNLEGERLTKFRELYSQYNEESRANNDNSASRERRSVDKPTEEEIEVDIKNSFQKSHDAIALKERYFLLFIEFMKPSEIETMYEIERRSRERFVDELQKRSGGRPQPQQLMR
ncbi:MAG: hypothetical protein SNF68_05265 [Rikenellaceae bacterium]